MAFSNVRSSEYRAAGGRQWHKVKNKSGIVWDGPKTETALSEENVALSEQDQYLVTKAQVREELAQGYDESKVTVIPAGKRAPRKSKGSKWHRKMVKKHGVNNA